MSQLSAIILDPAQTCAELRAEFRLNDLPIVDTPDQIGMKYEEQWVLTRDANVLHVWRLPSELNRGTVVFSMGSSGRMACYLFITQILVRDGWTVYMYDYRGFGESSGVATLSHLVDDAESVVDWARNASGEKKVTLMGVSLGTIPSVSVAVRRPDAVNGVILDSPVALSEEIKRFGILFSDPQTVIDGIDISLRSEDLIHGMYQPSLYFVNEADRVTPPDEADLLIERAGGPTTVVRFPGLDHALAPYVETAVYTFNLDIFLAGIWREQRR